MKKISIVLIVFALSIFASCGKSEKSSSSTSKTTTIRKERRAVKFESNRFIKNLKIDGYTLHWYENLGYSDSKHFDVGDYRVEYTTFSKNGFGHHLNEEQKVINVKVTEGYGNQTINLW